MAIRKIKTIKDPILTKTAKIVENFDERLSILIDDMKETMIEQEGIGIAANQVGILKRVIIVGGIENEDYYEFVNPEIVESSGEQEITEGCLSLPGEYGITKRPKKVKIKAFDRKGKKITFEAENFLAAAICHEIDHLNGILFKVRIIKKVEN